MQKLQGHPYQQATHPPRKLTWQRLEVVVTRISFVLACFGLVEKAMHYGGVFKRTYRKKRHPKQFGFVPAPEKRKR